MKLAKLARIKLPSSLKKLWTQQPLAHLTGGGCAARRSTATLEVDIEAAEQFMLAALEIQSSPSTRIESQSYDLRAHYSLSIAS
jgi:hypothetical protein